MMCVVTILWLAALSLTLGIKLHSVNKYIKRIDKKMNAFYEQESKKREGKEAEEESPDDGRTPGRSAAPSK
jgi:hypothetical protein